MSRNRIKSAHPKIKSPFIKGQRIFPKDFFLDEEKEPASKTIDNEYDKINATFDHSNPNLLNQSIEGSNKNSSNSKLNRSYRVINRKYVVPRNGNSEKRLLNINKSRSNIRNKVLLGWINRSNEAVKLSRNHSNISKFWSKPDQCKSSNIQSYPATTDSLGKPIRPVIKSKIQNYVKSSSNKSFVFPNGNQSIKLDQMANRRLNLGNMALLNNSDLDILDKVDITRNQSQASYKHSENYSSVNQMNKWGFNEFRTNFLKLNKTKRLFPSKRLSKKRDSSIKLRKNDQVNQSYTAPVNKTIEYHDQAMIEEFTDTLIPEFTLGPNEFPPQEITKPLSVNKMGFYEECKSIEAVISPIKKTDEQTEFQRLMNFNPIAQNNDTDVVFERVRQQSLEKDDDFYNNEDLVSDDHSNKWDSTKKYIDLVDTFRNINWEKEETPSFKIRDGQNHNIEKLKFEDVLNEDIRATQRSSNIHSDNNRYSSEVHTYRKTSTTRAGSDKWESYGATSKRVTDSHTKRRGLLRESVQFDKNRSLKEINIDNIMNQDPKRIKVKRKLFRSQNRLLPIPGKMNNFRPPFVSNPSCKYWYKINLNECFWNVYNNNFRVCEWVNSKSWVRRNQQDYWSKQN